MTITKDKIAQLEQHIEKAAHITLITHASPDADTVGSALAFQNVLRQMGKQVSVVCPNVIPDFLQWMRGTADVIVHDNEGIRVQDEVLEADLIFAMDFNVAHRTANIEKAMLETQAQRVLIDHHLSPDKDYFNLMFSQPEKSSTCELLFDILRASSMKQYISKEVATHIFVGLMTDTGSFAYNCDSAESFDTAAELIRYGVKVKETHDMIYNNNSIERLRMLGYCINEKLKVFPENKAAYISLSAEELTKFGNAEGLTEGVVNYALSLKGIRFAALLTEKGDKIKMSFRSKGEYSVNAFAREHFEGGGHHNAAGGKSFLSLHETMDKLEFLISKLNIES